MHTDRVRGMLVAAAELATDDDSADGVAVPELRGRGCADGADLSAVWSECGGFGMADVTQEIVNTALDRTFRELTKFQRTSFVRVLAELLECKPDIASLREFSKKSPDRWAQALSIVAALAGFTKDTGTTINIYNVEKMSDVELARRIAELERTAATALPVIDVAAEAVPKLGSQIPKVGIPSDVQHIEQDSGNAAAASGGDADQHG